MTSIGGSTRRRGLTDIVPRCDDSQSDKSQISTGSSDSDQRSNLSCLKIQHLTGPAALGRSRFPKLEECAHFHYDHVELNSIQLSLCEEEDLKSLSSLECNENTENKWLTVKVTSHGQFWLLRRTYENFRMLDEQLHQCIYDRKFSSLRELPPLENLPEKQDPQSYIKCQLSAYCERFSDIAGSLINCGPVLNWLQLDNRGRRILVTDGDSCPINTPAVAAAYAVKKYNAVAADEISFDIGDMISVIDMPPPEDSVWWRGKRGFMVGFFPSHCVAVITDKVPRNLQLNQPSSIVIEPSKPVLRKHGKLIAFFRAFILSRPSKRHLKQSGIFKERVFGCDLGEHLLNSGREVPMVLKCCSEFIEQHGIVDGIYRLSGATSNIQKLRTTFDEDRIPPLYSDDSILQDIHSVASLLKMYFRELPNPLCTYQLYKNFVNAVQNCDAAERVAKMREVVQKLPPPHFRTLEYLMRHLSKVAEHGTRTGMTARNIAIVWAPNLLRCKELEVGGVAALQGVGVQAVVTEFLISNVDLVFSEDRISIEGMSRRMRPKSLSIGTPTKLLSLEEARSKKLGLDSGHENYIEVGGGPSCLPVYHTVIDLPSRKRVPLKRSPLGWKSLFSRSSGGSIGLRKSSSTNSAKRKPSAPCVTISRDIEPTITTDIEAKTRLRTVKSAESLTSGVGNGASARNSMCHEYLSPPSPKLSGTAGHSRSVSHDSYFDHLAESTPIHSTLRPDDDGLSDLKYNFDLDESEMKIFSEESSQLFSNTSSSEQLQVGYHHNLKKVPLLASAENTIIVDPSPKKHKTNDNSSCSSATLSDDMTAVSKKRSRLEEQLLDDDFAYIDSQNDRLVVEVDVHHRESSQMSSPMNDAQCSDNETTMSGCCSMSDSTLANASVAYTPLSEYSGSTTNTSSLREPSYQRLVSSVSSSQLPRSSAESVRHYDSAAAPRRYENVPRNRFSYHGDLRPSSAAAPVVAGNNRLSLQTLPDAFERCCAQGPSALVNGDPAVKRECDWAQSAQLGANGHAVDGRPEAVADRLRGDSSGRRSRASAASDSDSAESAQNSEYENVRKLELILNDKEMFSDDEANESPYELVTVVGSRMTSVAGGGAEGGPFAAAGRRAESNYEEIGGMANGAGREQSDGNYEEMSAAYAADNDVYGFGGGGSVDGSEGRKTAAYEDVFVAEAADAKEVSSSNESLASSADEAMIENNLYESLVAEDSSPDPASNRSSKIVDGAALSAPIEATSHYKNFVVTLGVAADDPRRVTPTERSPLITSDIHSPISGEPEPHFYVEAGSRSGEHERQRTDEAAEGVGAADPMDVSKEPPEPARRPTSLPLAAGECGSATDLAVASGGAEPKNEADLLRSESTKSVQDLVSKFEWSADVNSNPPKEAGANQKNCRFDPKRDSVSLPPLTLRQKSSQESLSCAESPTDEARDGDESVRRDRIERYKEERRLALRQKYQVDDAMNDQKDAEMIRRFKQKILKNEKAEAAARSLEYDSSLATAGQAQKGTAKPPTPAVTTISILYTSKKRKESEDDGQLRPSVADSIGSGCPKATPRPKEGVDNGGHLLMSKSFGSLSDRVRELPLKPCPTYEGRRPFTASLERNMGRVRGFVKEESLVAKRVNQLSEASDVYLVTSGGRKSAEPAGSMRQRAHSTSGPGVPYCIRDIAAIFENKDNK